VFSYFAIEKISPYAMQKHQGIDQVAPKVA
jgi:hypothetical protein